MQVTTKRPWRRSTKKPWSRSSPVATDVVCSNTTSVVINQIPDGMPDSSSPLPLEFFIDPRCPLALTPTKATTTEAEQSKSIKKAKEPERSTPAGDQSCSLYFFFSLFFF